MATTQYTLSNGSSNGTSNVMGLLFPAQQQALRLIQPRDMEKVFGPGLDVDIPSKGYTDPEWYFKTSDGIIFGIGWRWGQARLRGRGKRGTKTNHLQLRHPSQKQAVDFVNFLVQELA
jgi:hypothetical protein